MNKVQPKLPAAKSWLGNEIIYWAFAQRSLRRYFDHIWFQSIGPFPTQDKGPYLFYLNHSSWWDLYLLMLINRKIFRRQLDAYAMQEEAQLRMYQFFRWSGAFSIDRHSPRDVARSLQYAVNLLHGGNQRAICIFPQGEILPNDYRPLTLQGGITHIIARTPHVTLYPIALRYEFLGQQWPHAFIRIGPPHKAVTPQNRSATLNELSQHLSETLDSLRDDVIGGNTEHFHSLLRGRSGIDRRFAAVLKWIKRS